MNLNSDDKMSMFPKYKEGVSNNQFKNTKNPVFFLNLNFVENCIILSLIGITLLPFFSKNILYQFL